MRALSSIELLQAWEVGFAQSPSNRALTLLSAACQERSPDDLAKLSIGRRDAMLLTLREQTFGSIMNCIGLCSGCGERMEFDLQTSQIRAEKEDATEFVSVTHGDYEMNVRSPNSLDLLSISVAGDVATARRQLLERCVISATRESRAVAVGDLPSVVVDAIEDALENADPQADLQLTVSCPSCGFSYPQTLDIVSFLWNELNSWACNLLHEVHRLASAYGWTEKEILTMSPRRRRFYLNLI